MEILVAEQEQLNRYSNRGKRSVSNVSLLHSKRKIPKVLQYRSTKILISEDDKRNGGCSSNNRTRTASRVQHFSIEVGSSNGKRLPKMQCIDSKVVDTFPDVVLDDKQQEDKELKFLLNVKRRRRTFACEKINRSSKDTGIGNGQTTNVQLCTSSSSQPSSIISSLDEKSGCAVRNVKVISLSMHLFYISPKL